MLQPQRPSRRVSRSAWSVPENGCQIARGNLARCRPDRRAPRGSFNDTEFVSGRLPGLLQFRPAVDLTADVNGSCQLAELCHAERRDLMQFPPAVSYASAPCRGTSMAESLIQRLPWIYLD